ncbi:MAG TPA: ABC transporter permease, partial [Thermoplasmata archaeon]|nr:ABC transporter permease [Thermoplasmata archaeon]
ITTAGVIITLVFGVLVLGVDIFLGDIDWLLLAVSTVLGMGCICVLGLALGGITFLTARHSIGINEGVAGIFYVMSGIIFPITALPTWAQSISKVLPVTYWMDSMRRALMPDAMAELSSAAAFDVTGLGGFSNLYIMIYLAISAAIFFVLSLAVFKFADGVARRKGKIDWTTSY